MPSLHSFLIITNNYYTICLKKIIGKKVHLVFGVQFYQIPGVPGEVQLEARCPASTSLPSVVGHDTTGGGGANPQDPETEPSHSEGRTGNNMKI